MANKKSISGTSNKSKQKNTAAFEDEYYEPSFFASPLFIHGVVWSAFVAFLLIFMFSPSDAVVSNAVRTCLGGLFGIMSFTIPFIFIGTLVYLVMTRWVGGMWRKFILSLLAMVDLSAIIGLFADYDARSAYDICSSKMTGGGMAGVAIADILSGTITNIGAFLLLFVIFVMLCCFIAHYNIWPKIVASIKSFCGFSEQVSTKVKEKSDEMAEKRRLRREAYEQYDEYLNDVEDNTPTVKAEASLPVSDDEELPMSLNDRFRSKKSKQAVREQALPQKAQTTSTIELANEFAADIENNADIKKKIYDDEFAADDEKFDLYNMKFSMDDIFEDLHDDDTADLTQSDTLSVSGKEVEKYDEPVKAEPELKQDKQPDSMPDFKVTEMKQSSAVKEEKVSFRDELDSALQGEHVDYKFPTLDLLDEPKPVSTDLRQELYNKAQQLISVLDDFGIKAKPVQVTQGPTVTRYEIQPASGIKLSKIVNLADDIAMNLAVSTVLIAPVPGKAGTVGVEIPNNKITPVSIREMLSSVEFMGAKSKLTVCLGKDIGGNVVVGDIAKWPHALIAGATGSGKSVCINTIVTSILYKADPNEVKLIMVDPKQVELGVYNGIPHLLIPVVTEAKKAAGALNWAVSEMMQRYDLFKNSGVRKLEMYNKLMERTGGEKLPQIVIIIDELADLMMVAAKEVEDYVCRLAQLARAAGIHLIIATQRPSVDVITGLIKANIPSRIAFFVSSQVDSRTIIDRAGAEKLLGMGDMLYYPTGARSTTRVQGAFVSDGEVERIVDFIKDTTPETHYREDLEEHIERIATGENGVTPDKDDDGDPLLNDAIKLAAELGKISTSMIQRRLSVGYSRAGRIIDQMEARGIISPANGSKPRDVLISHTDMMLADTEAASDE